MTVHQDHVDGYSDGYCLNAPEPNNNRSARYVHSFRIGRGEKTGNFVPHAEITASLEKIEREESMS